MFQRGLNREGQRTEGLRDLLERLKKQRQQQLDRYNLDSLMDDLKDRLKDRLRDVVDTERAGIDRRLNEARRELEEAGDEGERLQAPMRLLEERAERGKETLDALPESTAGALLELKEYDFIDPEARRKFQELLDMLNQQMLENFFRDMRQGLQQMTPEEKEGLKNML